MIMFFTSGSGRAAELGKSLVGLKSERLLPQINPECEFVSALHADPQTLSLGVLVRRGLHPAQCTSWALQREQSEKLLAPLNLLGHFKAVTLPDSKEWKGLGSQLSDLSISCVNWTFRSSY